MDDPLETLHLGNQGNAKDNSRSTVSAKLFPADDEMRANLEKWRNRSKEEYNSDLLKTKTYKC